MLLGAVRQFWDIRCACRPPAGQGRVFHEKPVTVECKLTLRKGGSAKASICGHHPALRDIGHVGGHDLAYDLRFDGGVFDLDQCFYTAVQVPAHPVG